MGNVNSKLQGSYNEADFSHTVNDYCMLTKESAAGHLARLCRTSLRGSAQNGDIGNSHPIPGTPPSRSAVPGKTARRRETA